MDMSNYTHFALSKINNKIVYEWDYSDIDPIELRNFRNDYFKVDLEDNGIDPRSVKILTKKMIERMGIDTNDESSYSNSVEESLKRKLVNRIVNEVIMRLKK